MKCSLCAKPATRLAGKKGFCSDHFAEALRAELCRLRLPVRAEAPGKGRPRVYEEPGPGDHPMRGKHKDRRRYSL
jgi:hypothetical protein